MSQRRGTGNGTPTRRVAPPAAPQQEPRVVEGILLAPNIRDALVGYLLTKPMGEVRQFVAILEGSQVIPVTLTEGTGAPVEIEGLEEALEQ